MFIEFYKKKYRNINRFKNTIQSEVNEKNSPTADVLNKFTPPRAGPGVACASIRYGNDS